MVCMFTEIHPTFSLLVYSNIAFSRVQVVTVPSQRDIFSKSVLFSKSDKKIADQERNGYGR